MQKVDYEALKTQLDLNEQADFKYQQRRHEQWTENYQLYRDRVIINRFTQRQSINIPLIKGIIKTVLALTDEFPDITHEELNNDKDKEIIVNELWKNFVYSEKLEHKDVVDKKQDFIYGKTWRQLNLVGGRITLEVKEPFDILEDRYSDPSDLETNDHLSIHGIFRTLDQLAENPSYDQSAVNRLKVFYATAQGLIKAEEVTKLMVDKAQRMNLMGVPDVFLPQLGTTVVELKVYLQKVFDLSDQAQHWHVIVKADSEILTAKPLKTMMGIDFVPLIKWSDDPERLDHNPDGIADIARTPNKLLNAMISAFAENRILRSYSMNYYNSSIEGFVPQTYQPTPFGWYGIPVPDGGKIDDVFKAVEVPDMTETLEEMDYVKKMVETAVAASSTIQGTTEAPKVTLGEVELAMQASKERITSISKFYMLAQKELGDKWSKILNANADKLDAVKLYKKSHKGNYFSKTVTGKHYKSDAGYECRAVSTAERQQQNVQGMQKLQVVKQQFPGNPVVDKIIGKKVLEFADVNPDEIKEVLDYQEQLSKAPQVGAGQPVGATAPIPPQQVTQPNVLQPA